VVLADPVDASPNETGHVRRSVQAAARVHEYAAYCCTETSAIAAMRYVGMTTTGHLRRFGSEERESRPSARDTRSGTLAEADAPVHPPLALIAAWWTSPWQPRA
jgi:hypothetical protein